MNLYQYSCKGDSSRSTKYAVAESMSKLEIEIKELESCIIVSKNIKIIK